ncbi:MAG: TIGR00282 family metallophosphoesterase [Ruminococcaceae bacterium]|nr:TIGR00282 family metallophosphoesterase [Oscillospiraceae bacterium]
MNIITIGDIVSKQGCEYLAEKLPELKRDYKADLVIANGENSAVGNGITPASAKYIFDCGVDVITLGNHSLRRQEIADYLEEHDAIVRPENYHSTAPGRGFTVVDKGRYRVLVANLQGTVYLDAIENPFDAVSRVLDFAEAQGIKVIILDFHAEASSEKRSMGFYLDGKVSAVVGTHTHVQTSDEQILPNGTAYITDLGMTGPYYSVLGVKPEITIQKFKTNLPVRFKNADGPCTVEGCFIEVDEKTGQAVRIERFRR